MLTVLLDADDVQADFRTGALGTIRQVAPHKVDGEKSDAELLAGATSWYFETCFGLTADEINQVTSLWAQPGWCYKLPMMPGVREAVTELRRLADVVTVTAPFKSPTWVFERDAWLRDRLGYQGDNVDVIHTAAKWRVSGDVFVDDRPAAVLRWQAAHPHGVGFIWAQPYNEDSRGLQRVSTWAEVVAAVKRLVGDDADDDGSYGGGPPPYRR